jgi:hypothetical protein
MEPNLLSYYKLNYESTKKARRHEGSKAGRPEGDKAGRLEDREGLKIKR